MDASWIASYAAAFPGSVKLSASQAVMRQGNLTNHDSQAVDE